MADHPATDGEGTPTEREWLEAVAADRLPDPRAGKERACKCGKMLVSNVIEVGFPCPFCGDKGGPVSAAVSPAEPPEAVTFAPRLMRVNCSQFAQCRWSGKRLVSKLGVQPDPCPKCGNSVIA